MWKLRVSHPPSQASVHDASSGGCIIMMLASQGPTSWHVYCTRLPRLSNWFCQWIRRKRVGGGFTGLIESIPKSYLQPGFHDFSVQSNTKNSLNRVPATPVLPVTFTMSCPTSVALTVTSNGLVGFQKKELLYSGSQTQSLVNLDSINLGLWSLITSPCWSRSGFLFLMMSHWSVMMGTIVRQIRKFLLWRDSVSRTGLT